MRRFRIVVVLFIILCFGFSGTASAKTQSVDKANGYHWDAPCSVLLQCDYDDFSLDERETIRNATLQWNGVKSNAGKDMVSFYLTTTPQMSKIKYSDTLGNYVGYTRIETSYNTQIYYVIVQLNSKYKYSIGAKAGCYDIYSVVLHELGHALGVAHCHEEYESKCTSSTCKSNVMTLEIDTNMTRRTFTSYDTTSYKSIYS